MPIVRVFTNVEKGNLADDLERKILDKVAAVLNKPLKDIIIWINAGERMSKNMDFTPMCIVEIHSIKVLTPEKNPGYTEQLLPFFCELIGVGKTSDFEEKVSKKVGEVLNKPVDKITVMVEAGKRMCKNLDSSPMCVIAIHSIKVFDPEKNPGYTDQLLPFFCDIMAIAKDRCTLMYFPLDVDYVGMAK